MPKECYVTLKVRLIEEEADGSRCRACGDPIYMRAVRVIVVTKNGKKVGQLEELLCQSCGEAIAEQFGGVHGQD